MWGLCNQQSSVLKLGIMILATALALGAFLYNPPGFSFYFPFLLKSTPNQSLSPIFTEPLSVAEPNSTGQIHQRADDGDKVHICNAFCRKLPGYTPTKYVYRKYENCDLFAGDWIRNPAGPAYTNETCDLIEEDQNCMKNGRPDSEYLYWRWSPRNCELPQFHAMRFLKMMRNKTWAFIGDSISKNHVQSLVCLLAKVEEAEVFYHDQGWKSKGWRFPSHNLTIYVIWSPFLTEAAIFDDDNGVSTRDIELHLDRLDKKWADSYKNMDYIIFATGKWFVRRAVYYENGTILGCHRCQNHAELSIEFAYRKALELVLNFVATSDHKGLIFFRTSTPDHFEGGEWSSEGKCNRKIPFKEGEVEMKDLLKMLRQIELGEFSKAVPRASENGVRLKLLDVTRLSLLRPDGHPGPYRRHYPFAKDENAQVQNDCLHWCLPGPIDVWNDIIMDMIVNG